MSDIEPIDPIQADLLKQRWWKQWHYSASWLYLIIVAFDFFIAPIGNDIILSYFHYAIVQWQPITLQGGGIFHFSFMAIIGIATYSKSQQMVEALKNMPDYSSYNGFGGGFNNQGGMQASQPLNPSVDPRTVLDSPHRGIGKAK